MRRHWDTSVTQDGDTGVGVEAACSTSEKNRSRRFLEMASTLELNSPGMWAAENQKSNLAAKNTRRRTRCIMCRSLQYVEFKTDTATLFSTTN